MLTNGLFFRANYNGSAIDDIGGRNGTLVNAPVYAANGVFGQAIDVESSSSQQVTHGTGVPIDNVGLLACSLWVKPESLGLPTTYAPWFCKGNLTPGQRTMLGHGGTGAGSESAVLLSYGNGSNTFGYSANSLLAAGTATWIYVEFDGSFTNGDATTQNNGRLKLWTNNVARSLTFSGNIPTTTYNAAADLFRTGNINVAYYDGLIWQLCFWNRKLTASERSQIYNHGAGLPSYLWSRPNLGPNRKHARR